MTTTTDVPALTGSGRSLLVRWLIAIVAFPIGGTIGHLIGGPAATASAALISGLIAGAIIGVGQGPRPGHPAPTGPRALGRRNGDRAGCRARCGDSHHRPDRHDDRRHPARRRSRVSPSGPARLPSLRVNESPMPGSGSRPSASPGLSDGPSRRASASLSRRAGLSSDSAAPSSRRSSSVSSFEVWRVTRRPPLRRRDIARREVDRDLLGVNLNSTVELR